MKKKLYFFLILIITIYISGIIFLMYKINNEAFVPLDIVMVNDIVQSAQENWEQLDSLSHFTGKEYDIDFIILDIKNNVKYKTASWVSDNMNTAISHRDTIVDIYSSDNTKVLGKLIIYNEYDKNLSIHKKELYITSIILLSIFMLLCLLLVFYIYRTIFRPFSKLQSFAKNIALGNLDIPLGMDKSNLFGAFTESFDIMRDELKTARLAEEKANKSKKELVAQLSHDIKTPIASIKAVAELLSVTSETEKSRKHLDTIGKKADQINVLITNMFNASLEELQELKVEIGEHSSTIMNDIIRFADYFHKIADIDVAQCLIYTDATRLTQVIDNIISNSYKYADTEIMVTSYVDNEYMIVEFDDFGDGVKEDELSLLSNKFYRAENSKGKSGAGLGLYISNYLMNKMDGYILFENTDKGFKVILMIKIV